MVSIFFSYGSADAERVRPIANALARQGWSVWWDRKIVPGERFEHEIEKALTDARCVVVAWSKTSINSEWVRNEADDARQRRVLVPLLLDDVRPPLQFRGIQAARLIDWNGDESIEGFQSLVTAIAPLMGARAKESVPQAPVRHAAAPALAQPASSNVAKHKSAASKSSGVALILLLMAAWVVYTLMQKQGGDQPLHQSGAPIRVLPPAERRLVPGGMR